jgi:hypothetical protein
MAAPAPLINPALIAQIRGNSKLMQIWLTVCRVKLLENPMAVPDDILPILKKVAINTKIIPDEER